MTENTDRIGTAGAGAAIAARPVPHSLPDWHAAMERFGRWVARRFPGHRTSPPVEARPHRNRHRAATTFLELP